MRSSCAHISCFHEQVQMRFPELIGVLLQLLQIAFHVLLSHEILPIREAPDHPVVDLRGVVGRVFIVVEVPGQFRWLKIKDSGVLFKRFLNEVAFRQDEVLIVPVELHVRPVQRGIRREEKNVLSLLKVQRVQQVVNALDHAVVQVVRFDLFDAESLIPVVFEGNFLTEFEFFRPVAKTVDVLAAAGVDKRRTLCPEPVEDPERQIHGQKMEPHLVAQQVAQF